MKKIIYKPFLIIIFVFLLFTNQQLVNSADIIQPGKTGEEVKELQLSLQELDLFSGEIDGIYGENTRKSVEKFQSLANITPDGIAGPKTIQALKSASGQADINSEIKVYTRGPEVIFIQKSLKNRDIYQENIDGIYGESSKNAVITFQKEMNIEADGIVDDETWKLLKENQKDSKKTNEVETVFADRNEQDTNSDSDNSEKNNNPVLKIGDSGESVKKLQQNLSHQGFYSAQVDGHFDLQTDLAVKLFQDFHGLKKDGIVGPATWKQFQNSDNNGTYTIQSGETLWDLSRKWNISVDKLKEINNLNNGQLKAGQTIKIPGKMNSKEVEDLSWSKVDKLFPVDDTAMITDVETGLSLRVKRLYGSKHADVEPLTAKDTKTLRKIYGGEWSWERRAVIVHINNRQFAGSINGTPHADQSIYDNNFPGHICLHFKGSRLHKNGHPDKDHQGEIQQSAEQEWPLDK
ncbi:MAG: peptidoglycan-binding protein [Halanaerobiaceae bacterium]